MWATIIHGEVCSPVREISPGGVFLWCPLFLPFCSTSTGRVEQFLVLIQQSTDHCRYPGVGRPSDDAAIRIDDFLAYIP